MAVRIVVAKQKQSVQDCVYSLLEKYVPVAFDLSVIFWSYHGEKEKKECPQT